MYVTTKLCSNGEIGRFPDSFGTPRSVREPARCLPFGQTVWHDRRQKGAFALAAASTGVVPAPSSRRSCRCGGRVANVGAAPPATRRQGPWPRPFPLCADGGLLDNEPLVWCSSCLRHPAGGGTLGAALRLPSSGPAPTHSWAGPVLAPGQPAGLVRPLLNDIITATTLDR